MAKIYFCLVLMVFPALCQTQGTNQALIGCAGGSAKKVDHEVDWSTGEAFCMGIAENSYMVTSGFHQPKYEIQITNTDLINVNHSVKLFPVPTTDFIQVDISGLEKTDFLVELFNLSGEKLSRHSCSGVNDRIDLTQLAAGEYFIKITDNAGELINSSKIIKF